jgi:Na+/pantothenate symporter
MNILISIIIILVIALGIGIKTILKLKETIKYQEYYIDELENNSYEVYNGVWGELDTKNN